MDARPRYYPNPVDKSAVIEALRSFTYLFERITPVSRQNLIAPILWLVGLQTPILAAEYDPQWRVAIDKKIITPSEPMWMSGYGSRNQPAEGKLSDLWAKVMTIEDSVGSRVVLVTLDLIGIDAETTAEIRHSVTEQTGIPASHIAISTTHTHSGPIVGHNLKAMYQIDYAAWRQVNRYTKFLSQTIIALIHNTSQNLTPAELHWTVGRSTFAVNRRNNSESNVPQLASDLRLKGPVDHDVPILVIADPEPQSNDSTKSDAKNRSTWPVKDRIRAIICGYACHATVLSGYQWCADWPGYAQSAIESRFPEATAMVWIGCGADQNPIPRRTVELAQQYGDQLDQAVANAIEKPLIQIRGKLQAELQTVSLDFAAMPTRQDLKQNLHSSNRFEASRASHLLERWDTNGSLESNYSYPIQSWKLGDGPLWFFLGGEVVIDYALRLKQELGAGATWITAYANDVMAYIPSERVLAEGGYEGGASMVYYGLPSPWKSGIESTIVNEVRSQAKKLIGIETLEERSLSAPTYPDHGDLSVFRDETGALKPIKNTNDWNRRKQHILESMQMVMGRLPNDQELKPLAYQVLATQSFDQFTRQTISYTVDSFADATAHLYLPSSKDNTSASKRPAVLALHPTSPLGKRIVAGEGPRPNRNYGEELANRGYIVLAPDYPSFGDQSDYDFHTDDYLSGTMKAIVNHRRGVDVLCSLTEVDPQRIGVIGHSLGGHNAIFLGAFDQRIQCVVSSCGWDPFPYYYGGRLAGWASDRYMPRIRELYGLDPKQVPFDLPEAIAAITPRAFFSCSPLKDSNFDANGVRHAEPRIASVYDLHQVENRFVIRYPNAEHDFPTETRNEAYEFLDHHLGVKQPPSQNE
ncbi:MAG: neutral/alkaline non-lysosomal ceramidase N-terminal domain-containing protein [Rubripirellula sp.]|nr:neutral/alkaline non-lysosomal ceramidase N-terminal domain-containing protein [Rubripirellula sp.]